jgi:hypothetical protein
MKRALVASILGLAASIVTSYGQFMGGYIFFNTYDPNNYAPVTWTTTASLAPAGLAGTQVLPSADFTADLLFSDSAGSGDTYLLNSPTTPTSSLGIGLSMIGGYGAGWILGPAVQFPYTSGSVTFTIELFQGASYAAAKAPFSGLGYVSLTWTEPAAAIATGESPVGYFTALPVPDVYTPGENGYLVVQLSPVPEPTTLAIVGLSGLATFMGFRRRK